MPLKKPQSYFNEMEVSRREALLSEQASISEARDNKRLRSPKKALGEVSNVDIIFNTTKPKRTVKETVGDIVEKIDLVSQDTPNGDEILERLSGIERSISMLHIDKLEKDEVLSLYENIEMLRDLIEEIVIPEPITYDDELESLSKSIKDFSADSIARDVSLREEATKTRKDINDNILENRTSYEELRVKVDEFIVPDIKGNSEGIETLRDLHSQLKEALEDLPNHESRFDPSSILGALDVLRESLNKSTKEITERVDGLPEIRHYEDDLDLLQNFIGEVKESIRYYDTDIDVLKESIVDLGKHLGETISNKVKTLQKAIKTGDKKLQETVDSLPEVKYYDGEIDVIEEKITNILKTITEMPEVKYYDEDVKALSSAIDKLNAKIDAIVIPDWTSVINNIQEEVGQIQDLQKDFDKRWEIAAADKEDPLKDTKFVTFEEMQKHYRTFLERVQIQLGTVGGGGAVEIMEMDDIEDDFRANPQNYDGYYLQHNWDPVTKTSSFTAKADIFVDVQDLDLTNAIDGNILVWDSTIGGLRLVTPQSQGINNDANPDPFIDDYGSFN